MSMAVPRLALGVFSILTFVPAVTPPLVAQPANDDCFDAIEVTPGVYPGTSLLSTTDGNGFCNGSASDVWYKFTAPFDGLLLANTCLGTNYDSVIAIWNGCPLDGGGEIDCNDDSCGAPKSSVDAAITASQTYYIRVSGFEGDNGTFTLTVAANDFSNTTGPDVVLSNLTEVADHGAIGGIHGYISDTHTCNIGDTSLAWGGTPNMTWNAYRLYGGRIEQIGMSWVKSGIAANAGPGCGQTCQGDSGALLGAGCRDVYGAAFNGDQSLFGPRSELNAFTGTYGGPTGPCGDSICKLLQINESDLDPLNYPDALYFFEVVNVAADDAASNNAMNNASHKRVTVGENFAIAPAGPIEVGKAAIEAWRNHGFGLNFPDPDIVLGNLDVPGEGRFRYAYKVTNLGIEWRYEYAVYNLNSDQSGGSFFVTVPNTVTVSNITFHDVAYHSGEPFDGTDWSAMVGASGVTWTVNQTYQQNPNANALRYGTMYNFGFTANTPPEQNLVTLGLFKPGDSDSVATLMAVPSVPVVPCDPGDVNEDMDVDGEDVQYFTDCVVNGFTIGGNCNCADMDFNFFLDQNDVFLFVFELLNE